MKPSHASFTIWRPPGRPSLPDLPALLEAIRERGAAPALRAYAQAQPHLCATYVHGQRHDLWWEFTLLASFQWQAHLARLPWSEASRRMRWLASELGVQALLSQRVEALSPAQRARADLAVALLPQPHLLVWEEPLALLSGADADRAVRLVSHLVTQEQLTVIAFAADPLALQRLTLLHQHVRPPVVAQA